MLLKNLLKNSVFLLIPLWLLSVANVYAVDADQKRRLALQHRLDYEVPLGQVTIVSSHNTYNSDDWGYPYPNHQRDLIDQLNAGIRGVNFDVHSVGIFVHEVLCHFSGDSSLFCRPQKAKDFSWGLQQLNNWLNDHPDEVVILVLEDYINDKRHDNASDAIRDNIGSKVYKPNLATRCDKLPLVTLTKQQVLDAGKQVIIATVDNCKHSHSDWRSWVWDIKQTAYKGNKYKDADLTRRDNHWSFVYEDRSVVGVFSNNLSASEAADAMRKGAGVIALDMILKVNRHKDAIWSWKANEPNSDVDNKDCALQSSNSKWQAIDCSRNYYHACQHPLTGDWKLSASKGQWNKGDSACRSLGDYIFSMPVNAGENARLDAHKSAAGINNVWLNYTDKDKEGIWLASHRWNADLTSFAPVTYEHGARIWGGSGGGKYDDTEVLQRGLLSGEPLHIKELAMRAGSRIDRVKVTYSNDSVVYHGGEGGSFKSIALSETHTLQKMEVCKAYTSKYDATTVHYIKFTLSDGTTLAGGTRSNSCVTLKSDQGYPIVGFRGGSGAELDSIGIIIEKPQMADL